MTRSSPEAPRRRSRVSESQSSPNAARRLLLDTNAWIWWQAASPLLGSGARRAITAADDVRVSIVTPWEVSIKAGLGKLTIPGDADIAASLERNAFTLLPVSLQHAAAVRHLPRHHRDPFDLMLIAQAQVEGLAIVTGNPRFLEYDVAVIDARR